MSIHGPPGYHSNVENQREVCQRELRDALVNNCTARPQNGCTQSRLDGSHQLPTSTHKVREIPGRGHVLPLFL
jgi:hypothetical protein